MIQPGLSYNDMNGLAEKSPVGSRGVSVIPFGNGAERVLQNKDPGCSFHGINFNIHTLSDIVRASQEGIVFSFKYGMEIMEEMGMKINLIRAGNANMFLSPVFRETLAGITGSTIELFDTDGAAGAAKAAGMGVGIYSSNEEAFASLKKIMTVKPDEKNGERYKEVYQRWKKYIKQ